MTTHNKTLQLLASRLGLGDEEKVLRKAAEFERLLQTKLVAGNNMTDTSKVVICLDLAAFIVGVDLDTKTAIKYSGLKPSAYTNCRKVVENLLEVNSDRMSIPGLCVMLQCASAQELAENILAEYQKRAKMEIDLNLPQYVCMAVYQACRVNKVKISKSKLTEKSRLKPGQWTKLEADWTKFVDENFATAKKKRGRPAKNAVINDESEKTEIEKCEKEEISHEPQVELYDDWKKRMLETAYKELEELQKEEQKRKQKLEELQKEEQKKKQKVERMEEDRLLSPTRNRKNSSLTSPKKSIRELSPRKNSQNVSPGKVVRLLIPKMDYAASPKVTQNSIRSCQNTSPMKGGQILSPTKAYSIQYSSPKREVFSPMQEDMSPRRSPRKTPQKHSPYKTPVPKNGVRLLFPKNL